MKVIVGDVHGCLEELHALLDKVGYVQGRDGLEFAGDFLDRGPDPVGVVALAMKLGARGVQGNHEEKALRWRKHEDRVRREPGYVNPVRGAPDRPIPESRKDEWRALSADQAAWLAALPLWLDLGNNWLLVHAGFEGRPLKEQRKDRVIRVRYVDPITGEMVPYMEGTLDQPEDTVPWQDAWEGPQNVVYGHAVHSLVDPRIDHGDGFKMVGIDTGCVYGGHLTAMVFDHPGDVPRFVQVKAQREYLPLPKSKTLS